ncbi:SbtR family transcriptional regulator [Streptomyces apricus]|uniref:Transcriptional regulator SbtR-like C-terminal domain-containing protein n=1 Tax=Streptomyces apricus TaxID=1828112 RepID=A0A5B0ABA6_9ACTN|nr:hypothetical protein [Streptomyces apricus]KAA0927030.1 hypothetical protein FGF04_31845 [Streptomyces apricus]
MKDRGVRDVADAGDLRGLDDVAVGAAGARATAQQGDAWTALVDYLEETMRLQATNRGLRALMCPAGSDYSSVQACRAVVDPCLEQVVELAHRQGTLRPDITARDITYLQVALVGIMDATADAPDAYRRHLALFLDGARLHPAATPAS